MTTERLEPVPTHDNEPSGITGSTSEPLQLAIITGMSGAGKSTAARVLEDDGWYLVDNIPLRLLEPLVELASVSDRVRRLAAVVDVRSAAFTEDIEDKMADLHRQGWEPRIIFVDSTDEALVRRFESVRRPHPLQGDGRLLDGIARERELLRGLRSTADVVIDTSGFNVHQLTAKISEVFGAYTSGRMRLAVMSFGFKYGLPLDADIVLDLRFLPNPYWVPELRPHNGKDPEVRDFVLAQEGAEEFLDGAMAMLEPMIEGYLREGRRYVTIAMGCTGGKHRSVAMAEQLGGRLASDETTTLLIHRDLGRE